jgi:hypothetical protein
MVGAIGFEPLFFGVYEALTQEGRVLFPSFPAGFVGGTTGFDPVADGEFVNNRTYSHFSFAYPKPLGLLFAHG